MEAKPNVAGLIEDYGRMVSSLCRRMVRNEDSAQDAAQEAWLEVMRSLPSFQGTAKVSTWIYTITARVALRHARRDRVYSTRFLSDYFRDGEIEMPTTPDFDKNLWVRQMCDRCLTGILHCLEPEARMAYVLRDMAGLPYDDVAAVLEQEPAAVRQVISRSRRKLKHFLEGECVLQNPAGKCACRMKRWVLEVNLPQEYQKLRQAVNQVNLFRESERALPKKNYWEKYL